MRIHEVERPLGIQIYGAHPDAMAQATELVTKHYAPDFIDINFGCPVKKVVQRATAGLGRLHGRAWAWSTGLFVPAWRPRTQAITVKTPKRLFDDQRNPVGIALQMQDAGAKAFTLHARTRTQMFSGHANWDDIAMVVEALDIPVIGNGDVNTPEDAVRMREHTGCAGVMVGRGSFGNPWLFRDARALLNGEPKPPAPDASDKFAIALQHARLAVELQGDTRHTVIEFRKHFGWYMKGLHGATALRQRLFTVETMAEAERIFSEYLEREMAGAARPGNFPPNG